MWYTFDSCILCGEKSKLSNHLFHGMRSMNKYMSIGMVNNLNNAFSIIKKIFIYVILIKCVEEFKFT